MHTFLASAETNTSDRYKKTFFIAENAKPKETPERQIVQ